MFCPSCGGEIGRECFDQQRCAEITDDMNRQQEPPTLNMAGVMVLASIIEAVRALTRIQLDGDRRGTHLRAAIAALDQAHGLLIEGQPPPREIGAPE